ncbi:MAG: hypothetical protein H0V79_00500 [Actinobacteria bacterium]|nr:hypothetical protein [Actinomycetota bacterium]
MDGKPTVKRMPALWLDVAVKLSLVLLLAFGVFSGLDRFAGPASIRPSAGTL